MIDLKDYEDKDIDIIDKWETTETVEVDPYDVVIINGRKYTSSPITRPYTVKKVSLESWDFDYLDDDDSIRYIQRRSCGEDDYFSLYACEIEKPIRAFREIYFDDYSTASKRLKELKQEYEIFNEKSKKEAIKRYREGRK